tara:strand:- start:209 stop:454 length:246 start_codon:yes stop_codon:yes gene_type:complete
MIKITQVANQYVLNINYGAVTVFETAEIHSEIMLVLKRKVRCFENEKEFTKSMGVQTLMGEPMLHALKEMHRLDIDVIKKD